MNFIKKLLRARPRASGGSSVPVIASSGDGWRRPAGEGARGLIAVHSAISLISGAVAGLPILVYKKQGKQWIEEENTELTSVLAIPNQNQSYYDFMQFISRELLSSGNVVVEIIRVDNAIVRLRPYQWNATTFYVSPTEEITFEVSGWHGGIRTLQPGSYIHIKDNAVSSPGLFGVSRLSQCALELEGINSIETHSRNAFANGLFPSIIVKFLATMDEDQRIAVEETLARYAGSSRAGKVLALGGGEEVKIDSFKVDPEQSQLLESRQYSVEQVCRLFHLSPMYLADFSHANLNNSREARRFFSDTCLLPIATNIGQAFSRVLFPLGDRKVVLDLADFSKDDTKVRFDTYASGIKSGVLTVEEARGMEGL